MHIQQIRFLAITISSVALFALSLAVASGQQATPADKSSEGVRLIDSAPEPAVKDNAPGDVREVSDTNSGTPTPAPKRPDGDGGLKFVDRSASDLQPVANEKPAAAVPPAKAATDDKDKLVPVADTQPVGPAALESTSFHGVTPGVSRVEDMEKSWGTPKEIHKQGKVTMYLYAVEPFQRVEASCADGKVTSVIIRFEKILPASGVAQQLELAKLQPVLISNELGEILGESYPERGVLFSFTPSETPGKPSMKVSHIILEPICDEPFVLRAETNIDTQPEYSLRDLDQAIKLRPDNARAHWLRCRVLASLGDYEKAMAASAEAVRLEPRDARWRTTRAQVLAHAGMLTEAAAEAQKAADLAADRPHVKARALCLLGDVAASGPNADYAKAMQYHMQAVETAATLASSKYRAIRIAAKEVLVDAHLGAAHDIAWGNWREKDKAVQVWLEKASKYADDLINNEGSGPEYRFRVSAGALAACVGLRGKIDPAPWTNEAIRSGKEMIAGAVDPAQKARVQWDMGMALHNAMQVCQMRSNPEDTLKYGELAADCLEKGGQKGLSQENGYLLGRLYFRIGAMYALRSKDHHTAVAWFDKALPLLEGPLPEQNADLERHGESFVSMGVSYWETSQRDKAVELTSQGVAILEQAVKQGKIEKTSLNIPYSNLASMHRQLGERDKALHFEQMANKNKNSELR